MFILYFIKILSCSRNFYRLRMTSLTYVNECFHDFMFVNRAPPRPGKFSSTALLQSFAKSLLHYSSTIRTIRRLFPDYSYYSSTIRGLFVLFVDYSRTIRTIRTIRRLFADYSYYSSTIRGLFVLFVDYSRTIRTIRRLFADYSYYSSTIRTIRTIRFTILVLSIAPRKFSSAALGCKALQSLYCTIRRLFVLFVAYSRTIRTIRRLFADYSYYSSTIILIRGLFVLFVDYSRTIRTIRRLFADYSYYSSTIRTIRFTILVLSIAYTDYLCQKL